MNSLIKKFKREHLTIWGCKDTRMSKRMKILNPNIKRFFSLGGISQLFKHFFLGNEKIYDRGDDIS